MNLLSIKNLKKYYSTQKAVDDISFNIPKGSIFGLLGPNGAGKSTLLRMITGIFHPDSGEILINNTPLNPAIHNQMMGYMPEERGLYKKMKIGEHVIYLAQLKGLSKQDALQKSKEWFKRLDMLTWWDKNVEDLSKGMSQKLQFVCTVVHEPELLILDEPFSGLDPVNANVLKDEIFRLAQEGTTIIFSTHRMEQVEEICDDIVLVNLGKKILDGSVNTVKQEFKEHLFHLTVEEELHDFPDYIKIKDQDKNTMSFYLEENRSANDVLQFYIQKNQQIMSFKEILPSLNDIFIRLVKETPTARNFSNL